MWQQGGRKMPILNNHNIGSSMDYQNPNPSLQQLAERNAVGDIKDMTNRQEYLKQIKKNAKAINKGISVRINIAKASAIGSAFSRPLIPPTAHDKIKIKISKNDVSYYEEQIFGLNRNHLGFQYQISNTLKGTLQNNGDSIFNENLGRKFFY